MLKTYILAAMAVEVLIVVLRWDQVVTSYREAVPLEHQSWWMLSLCVVSGVFFAPIGRPIGVVVQTVRWVRNAMV